MGKTYKRRSVPQIRSPHTIDLRLVLYAHHVLNMRRRDGVPEMRQHQTDRIAGLWRNEHLAVAPLASAQERPQVRIWALLHIDALQVPSDFFMDFAGLNE
jgi:hypothetical protein